jgi:hypothetical protein
LSSPKQAKVVGFEWKHWYDMEEPRGLRWHIFGSAFESGRCTDTSETSRFWGKSFRDRRYYIWLEIGESDFKVDVGMGQFLAAQLNQHVTTHETWFGDVLSVDLELASTRPPSGIDPDPEQT